MEYFKIVETYKDEKIITYMENSLAACSGVRKQKTVYEDNRAYVENLETGERRRKTEEEILKVKRISYMRAKTNFKRLVRANVWQWFATMTFDGRKVNRYDDKEVYASMLNYLMYLRKQFPDMIYVCVPEFHKDNAIHFHLLFGNVTAEQLGLVKLKKTIKGHTQYKITTFKIGRTNCSAIVSLEKTRNYVLKYMSKYFSIGEKSAKRYFHSRNCLFPEITIEKEQYMDYERFDCGGNVRYYRKDVIFTDDVHSWYKDRDGIKMIFCCPAKNCIKFSVDIVTVQRSWQLLKIDDIDVCSDMFARQMTIDEVLI